MNSAVIMLIAAAANILGAILIWLWHRRGQQISELEASLRQEKASKVVLGSEIAVSNAQEEHNEKLESYTSLKSKYNDLLKRLGLSK